MGMSPDEITVSLGKHDYYKVDKDGVLYDSLGNEFSYNDSIRVKFFIRSAVSHDLKDEKEFKIDERLVSAVC